MRVLVDYRPALRDRSGVGEYVHQACCAFAREYRDDRLTLFTSSWKDRPDHALGAECPGARVSDHRIPVTALNFAWHRLEWPPVETIAHGEFDVAFSPHPLLMPARRAAQVVMVHDLDFLRHPERTVREIQRDYPRLAASHAMRAARVVVPSPYTADEVARELGVPRGRIAVCPPGAPKWREPVSAGLARDGYVLFMGTLEPRKNVNRIVDAFERVIARRALPTRIVVAGKAGPEAQPALARLAQPPLADRVVYRGYVPAAQRQTVYAGARVLVLASLDEGFGMPVLEAMSLGVPVVVSNRGALPDLAGDAGLIVDPEDAGSIADAVARVLDDDRLADAMRARGLERARAYEWMQTARALRDTFSAAINEARRGATGGGG